MTRKVIKKHIMLELLSIDEFEKASEIVKNAAARTELVLSEFFSAQSGNNIFLKPENMQYTGSYKLRGAYYKISTMSDEERSKGLITASAGNHAQGVAYAAKKYGVKKLRGDGDFKSEECLKYLDIADIVVTNPPFSKFKEYLPLLINYNKKFLVIGDKNQITYEDIFPLFKSNKIWLGYTRPNKFLLPNGIITDKMNGRPRWFTNLNIKKRDEELILYKEYNASEYPKLENFDAIFVDEIAKIPNDYYETMAVPITFLDKYNPKQFEILGCSSCISLFGIERKEPSLEFLQKYKMGKVRTKGNYQKSKPMWIDSEGYANIGYHRIFIRRK